MFHRLRFPRTRFNLTSQPENLIGKLLDGVHLAIRDMPNRGSARKHSQVENREGPTHEQGNTIDLVLPNIPGTLTTVEPYLATGSDHYTIVTTAPQYQYASLSFAML